VTSAPGLQIGQTSMFSSVLPTSAQPLQPCRGEQDEDFRVFTGLQSE
jgi:hypothetical protein